MIQENEVQIVSPPPPHLLKTRELPGAPPPGALRRAPGPQPYEARADTRAVRFAHTRCATRTDFSAHPFFWANSGSATVHIPPCSSKSLAPPDEVCQVRH